jgi:hypothetical protein
MLRGLLIAVWLLLSWDVYLIARYGTDAALSQSLRQLMHQEPIVPFILGVLIGHLIWSR